MPNKEYDNDNSYIDELVKRSSQLREQRVNWDNNFQLVAEYVWTNKADFTETMEAGRFLNNELYDTTAYNAMITRASALTGMVWGDGKFRYVPSHESLKDDPEAIEFFERSSQIIRSDLQNPSAALEKALYEVELYDSSFGTSCLILADNGSSVKFSSLDLKEIYIDENEYGQVDTLFRMYELTVRQAVKKYGLESLSKKTQGLYKIKEYDKKVTFLHVIQPREEERKTPEGVLSMPYESIHIELNEKKLVKESGFEYQPFFVHRENKKTNEKYGRGAGFNSISDNKNLQTVTADIIMISNRYADPPLVGINAVAGGDIINKSPGGWTSFTVTNSSSRPVYNLIEEFNGNLNVLVEYANSLKEKISQAFDLDRLLDFNNETQMTATEAIQRAALRQQSLGSKFTSRIVERYTPMLVTIFNIYLKSNRLGFLREEAEILKQEYTDNGMEPPLMLSHIIPDSIAKLMGKDENIYDVVYYTPQAQEKMLADSQITLSIFQNAGFIAQTTQSLSVFDNLNSDEAIRNMSNMSLTSDIFRSVEEVKEIRDSREAEQEKQIDLANAKEGSEAMKNVSAAMSA